MEQWEKARELFWACSVRLSWACACGGGVRALYVCIEDGGHAMLRAENQKDGGVGGCSILGKCPKKLLLVFSTPSLDSSDHQKRAGIQTCVVPLACLASLESGDTPSITSVKQVPLGSTCLLLLLHRHMVASLRSTWALIMVHKYTSLERSKASGENWGHTCLIGEHRFVFHKVFDRQERSRP